MSCIKARSLLLVGLFVVAGCQRTEENPLNDLPAIEARPGYVQLAFDRAVELDELSVYDEQNILLQHLPTAGRRRVFEVPFGWRPGNGYRFVWSVDSHQLEQAWQAPADSAPVRFELEAPLGQTPWGIVPQAKYPVLVPADGVITVALVAISQVQAETDISFACLADEEIEIVGADASWQRFEERQLDFNSTLRFEEDYVQVTAQLRLRSPATQGRVGCAVTQIVDGAAQTRPFTLELRTATPEQLASWIVPVRVDFPADAQGRAQPERLSDSVVLADPVWSTLRRWFRSSDTVFNFHAPFGHHALELQNQSDLPLNVVVESGMYVGDKDEPLLNFAPPLWAAPLESATSEHLLRLPPQESVTAVLPLFVRPTVEPGTYERRFRVFVVGSHAPLATFTAPVYVVRGNALVSSVVLFCLVTSFAAWGVFGWSGRRLLRRLDNDALAIIATISSLHFVISYAARVGGDVLASVTGPFNLFIAGLANEGLTCLMLALLIVLLPRPGTATVSGVTVFLLNAMFTGQFGLDDLLFVTISVLLTEAALALTGVTTRGLPFGQRPTLGVLGRIAGAIGLANALTWYAQFCLLQVLLRLYYADWYIVAVCVLPGAIYGGLGAALGTSLGYRLRRTAR